MKISNEGWLAILTLGGLLGMYVALAFSGAKKSECKMEAIRAKASVEVIALCDKM